MTSSELVPALMAKELSKRYGALQACDQVSLTVRPGEIHALIGPNCGARRQRQPVD